MATMASSSLPLLSLLLILLLASSAAARPCKTLFISTYSLSLHNRPQFFAVVAEIRQPRPISGPNNPHAFILSRRHQSLASTSSSSSLRDRALDVLTVLSSLLFGAACGALTAAALYLFCSLFHSRFLSSPALHDDEDDDIFNPIKPLNTYADETYVAVPADPSAADSTASALLNKQPL